jgi:hypothetical protein
LKQDAESNQIVEPAARQSEAVKESDSISRAADEAIAGRLQDLADEKTREGAAEATAVTVASDPASHERPAAAKSDSDSLDSE